MLCPVNVCRFLGLVFLLLGLAYTFNPVGMFGSTGETLAVAAAITDIRAVYGGMEIGIGLFLLWQSTRSRILSSELLLMILIFASLLFSRGVGIALDEGDQSFNYVIVVVEIVCLTLAFTAYRKASKSEQN